MTQLASGTVRLRAGADTLLIGHRAAFGHGRGLCRLDSEDEVRRRLIQATADRCALDSLRTLWARYHFDTRGITHMADRVLIDRVVRTTVRGALAAYVVPDASVKHALGSSVANVAPRRSVRSTPRAPISHPVPSAARPHVAPVAGVDGSFISSTSVLAGDIGTRRGDELTIGPLQVALMPLEQRILEVLRRAPRRMPAQLREQSTKLFEPELLASTTQVLACWAASHAIGAGFQIEALLLADGLTRASWAGMEAAEKLDVTFETVRRANDERQLDDAALSLAQAIELIGIAAFVAAIWRGSNRFTSVNKNRGSH